MTSSSARAPRAEDSALDAPDREFRAGIVACLPNLRAFARFLIGTRDRADDLVSEAIARALTAQDQFVPGTNLRAWLFTILRHEFLGQIRREKKLSSIIDSDIKAYEWHRMAAPQSAAIELNEVRAALTTISPEHREILILVGAAGLSYEEAAEICGCAVGTIKSRLSRARAELRERLAGSDESSDLSKSVG